MRGDHTPSVDNQESELRPLETNSASSGSKKHRTSLPSQRGNDFGMSPMMQMFTSLESDKEAEGANYRLAERRLASINEDRDIVGLTGSGVKEEHESNPPTSGEEPNSNSDHRKSRLKTEPAQGKSTILEEELSPRSKSKVAVNRSGDDHPDVSNGMKGYTSRYRRKSQKPAAHQSTDEEPAAGEKKPSNQNPDPNLLPNLLGALNFPLGLMSQNIAGLGSGFYMGGFGNPLGTGISLTELQGGAEESLVDFVARKDEICQAVANLKKVPLGSTSTSTNILGRTSTKHQIGRFSENPSEGGIVEQVHQSLESKISRLTSVCEYLITQCGILSAEAQANRVKYKERGKEISELKGQIAQLQIEQRDQQRELQSASKNKGSHKKSRSRSRRSPRKDQSRSRSRREEDRSDSENYRAPRREREFRVRRRRTSPQRSNYEREATRQRQRDKEDSQMTEETSEASLPAKFQTSALRKRSSSRKHLA